VSGPSRLRVLQSVRRPSPQTNPYVVQLVRSLEPFADVSWFSWRQGVLGRYDVLHVHWPEVMLRRAGRLARAAARARFALLLARLAVSRRVAVVRTAHNVTAHESGQRLERWLLDRLDRRTDAWITLTAASPGLPADRVTLIPHGDYQEWYSAHEVPPRVPGRLAYVGLIRPYKRVDALLEAFAKVPDDDLTLHVAGRPTSEELRRTIEEGAGADARVTALLDYVDDATLAREIGSAELVVLPYSDFHNSGVLLLALSLGRPVLAPATPSTLELCDEFGADWVITYSGDLSGEALESALATARSSSGSSGSGPDFSRRRWPDLAAQHADAYRRALTLRR
jgi:beta-1,4-mannosyltransferase